MTKEKISKRRREKCIKSSIVDIFPDYTEIIESTGLRSLAEIMQENGYSTFYEHTTIAKQIM